ncbi:hypothetical protein ABPG75_002357 [Micractinium tetrahymenae]
MLFRSQCRAALQFTTPLSCAPAPPVAFPMHLPRHLLCPPATDALARLLGLLPPCGTCTAAPCWIEPTDPLSATSALCPHPAPAAFATVEAQPTSLLPKCRAVSLVGVDLGGPAGRLAAEPGAFKSLSPV